MRRSQIRQRLPFGASLGLVAAGLLAGCGGGGGDSDLPQLNPATGAALASCTDLVSKFSAAATTVASAAIVPAGGLTVAGVPVGEHCLVKGKMHERVSPVDGQTYAIGFEMRLPKAWNGRFFYQANGGLDGSVLPAIGAVSGGGALTHALSQGFAVINSDAGHTEAQNNSFGIDPQARLDYGYQAVAKLTPMAKGLIRSAYGKGPDRSYIGGCSNGGRHTMVAAARYGDQYDGYLAGAPGYNLPKATVAGFYTAQQLATVMTPNAKIPAGPFAGAPDLSTGFTGAERKLVANKILEKCDALDGAADGLVQDVSACQKAFSLVDVPTCTGARDGSCLSTAQKSAIGNTHIGGRDGKGAPLYNSFPYDAGLTASGTDFWLFAAPLTLSTIAMGSVFQVPPGPVSALTVNVEDLAVKIFASNATYTESGMSFMTPPNPTQLSTLKNRGAKMMVYHGVSDRAFSVNDTTSWYDGLAAANGGDASNFARVFRVPSMNHCSGGPSTDQFDMLTPLVNWVEKGQAPDSVIASARGAGNAGGANLEVPATWSASRTRPLCPYPKVARYKGSGDSEKAESFSCQ